jgi:hypothetical protein
MMVDDNQRPPPSLLQLLPCEDEIIATQVPILNTVPKFPVFTTQ